MANFLRGSLGLFAASMVVVAVSSQFRADMNGAVTRLAPQAQARPCESDDYRKFDFWLGEWKVTAPARPKWHARSSITSGNGGCSVHERYTTPGGYEGSSVNFYDATKGHWQQTWIDNQGGPLYLVGGIKDGKMILSDGSNEITWTPLEDGRVRQHWQSIDSEGKKTTVFDGYYEPYSGTTEEQ